jgi:hypothetical protein
MRISSRPDDTGLQASLLRSLRECVPTEIMLVTALSPDSAGLSRRFSHDAVRARHILPTSSKIITIITTRPKPPLG